MIDDSIVRMSALTERAQTYCFFASFADLFITMFWRNLDSDLMPAALTTELCVHKHDDAPQSTSVCTNQMLRETQVGGMTSSYDSSLAAPSLHHMQKLVWPNG